MDERELEVLGLSELVSLGAVAETARPGVEGGKPPRSRSGLARTSGQLARAVVTCATLHVAVLAHAGTISSRSVALNVSKTARTTPLVERPSDIRDEFERLATKLQTDMALVSSASQIAAHPAYRRIIELGQPVVPLILETLAAGPAQLFGALRELTGENPVPREARGNVPAMIAAWTEWGRARGLVS